AAANALVGATFSISPNPYWCHSNSLNGAPTPAASATGSLSVIDNDANDANASGGRFEVGRVCLYATGYTVTETAAPAGFALASPASQGPTALTGSTTSLTISFTFANRLGEILINKNDTSGA